jgi:ethanolamine transporter EutH
VLLFLVYLKQLVPNNLFGVLIALVVPLQMEKSNMVNHIQVFRQLVSA